MQAMVLLIQKYLKVMSMNQIVSNRVCEFAGCTSRVSNVIEVKVGHLGRIPLYLCKDCIIKFKDELEASK
jgi:hypothetical protein